MKNINYTTHDVESNGDCFFAVIRDAFKQIGYITTVSKLRAILSKNVTEDVFNEHRQLFIDLAGTINGYNREEMLGQEGNRNHIFHYRIPWYR